MNIKKFFQNIILPVFICLLLVFIILYPDEFIKTAREGLSLWLNNVFPSLFPFFVVSQLLLGLGVVNFVGTMFEPIMRPLLNVPGEGAFCFSMGITSGYPMGSKLIASLRNFNSCTKYEAERLMSFCNSAGPLFILGVVGAGVFDNRQIGYLLLLCNYSALITTGLIFKHHGLSVENKKYSRSYNSNIFIRAMDNMRAAQKKDGRSLNILFSDSIKDGINLMLMIGGYIITFSIIVKMLNKAGFTPFIAGVLNFLSHGLISNETATGVINGIFEMTVGCNSLNELPLSVFQKTMLAGFIIAWGGFSTHAQVIGVIEKTDISYITYFWAKVIHSLLTPLYIFISYPLIIEEGTVEALNNYDGWLYNTYFSLLMLAMVLIVIAVGAVINGLAIKSKS